MCDHYDSYYRMTPEEEAASKAAEKKEAARIAEYHRKREEKLATDFSKRFGVSYQNALTQVRKIQFVMGWKY